MPPSSAASRRCGCCVTRRAAPRIWRAARMKGSGPSMPVNDATSPAQRIPIPDSSPCSRRMGYRACRPGPRAGTGSTSRRSSRVSRSISDRCSSAGAAVASAPPNIVCSAPSRCAARFPFSTRPVRMRASARCRPTIPRPSRRFCTATICGSGSSASSSSAACSASATPSGRRRAPSQRSASLWPGRRRSGLRGGCAWLILRRAPRRAQSIDARRTRGVSGTPLACRPAEESTQGQTMTTSSDRLLGIPEAPSVSGRRWLQLVLGLICMMAISSPQYVWALMTKPMTSALGVSLPQLQVTFSLLIVCQTFLSPLQGLLIERFGPRWLLSLGGLLTGLSWILAARATDLPQLYVTYGILGGIGTGIIYVGIVGHMVQWFPDRRGFATGMVAAGYGMGAVVTTFPISASIASAGYQQTLLHFGLVLGAVAVLAAQGMRRAPADWMARRSDQGPRATDAGPSVVLRSPVFWLMFLMFTMMSTSGLMVISQMGAFARDFGVSSAAVLGAAALPLALTLDGLTNGLTRPFFGWISDRIGREPTMLLAFGFEGLAMTL